jgi:hypothetical protein
MRACSMDGKEYIPYTEGQTEEISIPYSKSKNQKSKSVPKTKYPRAFLLNGCIFDLTTFNIIFVLLQP